MIIIGEMYALLLEHAGLTVERKLNLGGTAVAQEALITAISTSTPNTPAPVCWSCSARRSVMSTAAATPEAASAQWPQPRPRPRAAWSRPCLDYVKSQYKEQFNLVWLDQTTDERSQALAVTQQFSEDNNVTTISQLVALASTVELTILAPSDFEERDDGLKGLQSTYGDFKASVNGVAPGIKYQASSTATPMSSSPSAPTPRSRSTISIVLQDDKGLVAALLRRARCAAGGDRCQRGDRRRAQRLCPGPDYREDDRDERPGRRRRESRATTVAKDFLTEQKLI